MILFWIVLGIIIGLAGAITALPLIIDLYLVFIGGE